MLRESTVAIGAKVWTVTRTMKHRMRLCFFSSLLRFLSLSREVEYLGLSRVG